jgi:hypothetical protein
LKSILAHQPSLCLFFHESEAAVLKLYVCSSVCMLNLSLYFLREDFLMYYTACNPSYNPKDVFKYLCALMTNCFNYYFIYNLNCTINESCLVGICIYIPTYLYFYISIYLVIFLSIYVVSCTHRDLCLYLWTLTKWKILATWSNKRTYTIKVDVQYYNWSEPEFERLKDRSDWEKQTLTVISIKNVIKTCRCMRLCKEKIL